FEMSFMDPAQRDLRWLVATDEKGRPRIDPSTNHYQLLEDEPGPEGKVSRFEKYVCRPHPRLVRLLRDKLHYNRDAIIRFLDETHDIPSQFVPRDEVPPTMQVAKQEEWLRTGITERKKNRANPFPVLPQRDYDPNQEPSLAEVEGEPEAFAVARSWFAYAQE